jgi:hypothetical protein
MFEGLPEVPPEQQALARAATTESVEGPAATCPTPQFTPPDPDPNYHIVSADDLRLAAQKTTMYVDTLPTKRRPA